MNHPTQPTAPDFLTKPPVVTPSEDDDLRAVTATPLAKASGVVAIGTGLYTLLLALQTSAAVRLTGALAFIVPSMIFLGVTLLVCGWSLRKMRGWAATSSALVGGLVSVGSLAWFGIGLTIGLLTLMPLIVFGAAATTCVLAMLCIGPARRADVARERLLEQDVNLQF